MGLIAVETNSFAKTFSGSQSFTFSLDFPGITTMSRRLPIN